MELTGKYLGFTVAELTLMRTDAIAARRACLVAHQSFNDLDFQANRVDFKAITEDLAEIEYALSEANGTLVDTTYVDLSV